MKKVRYFLLLTMSHLCLCMQYPNYPALQTALLYQPRPATLDTPPDRPIFRSTMPRYGGTAISDDEPATPAVIVQHPFYSVQGDYIPPIGVPVSTVSNDSYVTIPHSFADSNRPEFLRTHPVRQVMVTFLGMLGCSWIVGATIYLSMTNLPK
jgi:hypothetical protein